MRFSLLHATRGRPEKCLLIRSEWLAQAKDPARVEHIFGIDADDEPTLRATANLLGVVVGVPKGCFRAYNAAAAVSTGDLLIPIEDDTWPEQDWDDRVEEAMRDWIGDVAMLSVCDGQNECIEWAVTRKFYEARGLYHDSYFGLFGDTEMRERARADHVLRVRAPHIRFEHRQFQPGGSGRDPIYERKQALYLTDEATYNQRARDGWPA